MSTSFLAASAARADGPVVAAAETSEAAFLAAAGLAASLPDATSSSDKLILYGLYKQATVGAPPPECCKATFNVVAQKKLEAWVAVRDKSTYDARVAYCAKVAELAPAAVATVTSPPKPPPRSPTRVAASPEPTMRALSSGSEQVLSVRVRGFEIVRPESAKRKTVMGRLGLPNLPFGPDHRGDEGAAQAKADTDTTPLTAAEDKRRTGEPFAAYVIAVSSEAGVQWEAKKRWSDLRSLEASLRETDGETLRAHAAKLPVFEAHSLWQSLFDRLEPTFLSERAVQMQALLQVPAARPISWHLPASISPHIFPTPPHISLLQ